MHRIDGELVMVKEFKITVVVPAFNTERYIEETLKCIQSQSIGFENIQLILINDGSTDGSSVICRRFQKMNEENVIYKELPVNRGVSHARNMGLHMAEGKYITFWDADDLWSLNALERAVQFIDEHTDEVDMVCSNLEFFDGGRGAHQTNFELHVSQVINIHTDYKRIRNTMGGTVAIKTAVARKYQFDEEHKYWEDAKYINSVILRKQQYGMLSDTVYYYRLRRTNDSAAQLRSKVRSFFLQDLEAFFEELYKESMTQFNEFIPMLQCLMGYTMGVYFQQDAAATLREKELIQYRANLTKILGYIEDKYLKEAINVNSVIKCKMLAFKYGVNMQEELAVWEQREGEVISLHNSLQRTVTNYNTLKKWFGAKQKGICISDFFTYNAYKKIAIYGMSDLGIYLYQELAETEVEVSYGIDRRADKLDVEIPVFTVEEELPVVDAVVVTAVYFFDQIEELLKNKVGCPVLSLEDILQSI